MKLYYYENYKEVENKNVHMKGRKDGLFIKEDSPFPILIIENGKKGLPIALEGFITNRSLVNMIDYGLNLLAH